MATKILQAKRYAQAIFEIARERQEFDKWQTDLRKIVAPTKDIEFVGVMDNPRFSFGDKSRLLLSQVKDISPLALNLAHLLINKGKFSLIGDVSVAYQQLLDSYRGIEQAEVTTAVPLDEKERLRLAEHLGKLTGKKIIINPNLDPNILGGIIIKIGGKLIEGSTSGRLLALKSEIESAG